MKSAAILCMTFVLTGLMVRAQTETPAKSGEAAAENPLHGTWIPRGVEPMEEGISPQLMIHKDGRFSITAQDGEQFFGTCVVIIEDGKKILTSTYNEPEKVIKHVVKEITAKQMVLENSQTKRVTVYHKIEPASAPNPDRANRD
jgi:hypothetical protein